MSTKQFSHLPFFLLVFYSDSLEIPFDLLKCFESTSFSVNFLDILFLHFLTLPSNIFFFIDISFFLYLFMLVFFFFLCVVFFSFSLLLGNIPFLFLFRFLIETFVFSLCFLLSYFKKPRYFQSINS